MSDQRRIWFIDRYGAEVEDDTSLAAFATLFDAISSGDADAEHTVMDLCDSDDWGLEFSTETATLQQLESGGEVLGDLTFSGRAEALDIADEFINGDFASLRARPWSR